MALATCCRHAIFFRTSAWGVTTAWLRQYTQRLVHQFVSFEGEAKVHTAAASRCDHLGIVPDAPEHKLAHMAHRRPLAPTGLVTGGAVPTDLLAVALPHTQLARSIDP